MKVFRHVMRRAFRERAVLSSPASCCTCPSVPGPTARQTSWKAAATPSVSTASSWRLPCAHGQPSTWSAARARSFTYTSGQTLHPPQDLGDFYMHVAKCFLWRRARDRYLCQLSRPNIRHHVYLKTIWGHSVPFIENLQDDRLITLSLSHHKRGPFLILFYWNTRIAFWFFSNAQGVKVPSGWFKFQEDWKKWMQSHHQLFAVATSFLPSPWFFCGCPKSTTAALKRRHMCEGHTASREFSSTTGFDFCYFSVIPAEPRVPRIPLALFRDTPDDSMENQETWALSSTPIPNEILSQIISILIETWKRGSDRYEAQRELPARSLPSNTALSPPCRRAAVHRQRRHENQDGNVKSWRRATKTPSQRTMWESY